MANNENQVSAYNPMFESNLQSPLTIPASPDAADDKNEDELHDSLRPLRELAANFKVPDAEESISTRSTESTTDRKEEDEVEKIMPKEIRQKIRSIVPVLMNIVEDDKPKRCSCKCTLGCLNTCCLPCSNPCRPEKLQIFTEALQKGSEAGRAIFKEIVFPLIRPFTRDLIAISEFLIGLISLILSIVTFSLGNNAAYNILHLVLAILSTILGLIDMIVSLKFSSAFANVIKSIRNRARHENNHDIEALITRTESDEKAEPSFLKKGWDTSRILIAEAILYPLLVCDLIEFIVDKGYEGKEAGDIVNFILFVISILSLIFYVYIVRLGVLISMVIHLHKCRTVSPRQSENLSKWWTGQQTDPHMESGTKIDPTIAKNGMKFQIYFVLHVMGQMAAQIMMIVAVSLKIAKDNENRTLEDSPLHISSELWFMLCTGYIMPFLGILSFFIPTFYWVYEHENGLCIDFLSLLSMPGIDHLLFPDGDEMREAYESIEKIAMKLQCHDGGNLKLKEDFEKLRSKGFGDKLGFAFRNPFLVAGCLAYSFAQLAFVIVTIAGIQSANLGTVVYYILSILIGILANVYVFLVAALWTASIVCVLVASAVVIELLVMVIALVAVLIFLNGCDWRGICMSCKSSAVKEDRPLLLN